MLVPVVQEKCAKCTHIPKNDLPHCVISMRCQTVAFCFALVISTYCFIKSLRLEVTSQNGLSKGMLVMQSNIDYSVLN